MAIGDQAALATLIHPEATNREAIDEPADCRVQGPAAFTATSQWLRQAWSDIAFTADTCVARDDLVVTYGTMSGRHTGPFTVYDDRAQIAQVFPATGRSFTVDHAHFFRMKDGRIVEHWAVRDDRSLGEQLGWAPPSPIYALRMSLATALARRQSKR
ncbi:ester cyclase [Mobilicoccus massiliensis]|uniref:ester cyclase n=1 Tax=Mobilicoccus massiliensis TaxID=1522310 RepID=UPI001C3EFABB|nr:ester cyclase [Mobilicoccus massiliensis]